MNEDVFSPEVDFDTDIDEQETAEEGVTDLEDIQAVNEMLMPHHRIAPEDLDTLLEEVGGLRPVFEGTIDFCREPRRGSEVDAKHAELTEYNFCTFTPVGVRAMLQAVGALQYIPDEEAEAAMEELPEITEDGYYTIQPKPEGFWVATEDALRAIDSKNRVAEVRQLLDVEERFVPVYTEALQLLADSPRTINELNDRLNDREIMVSEFRFASALVKRLEERRAVEFRGKWEITDTGRQVLAELLAAEGE
ncbi:MAG: hypothetical protein IKF96_03460 [Eggerthellaceae bacterium]|nr:hypothetical protein [Eggerthellaceae bacterium]